MIIIIVKIHNTQTEINEKIQDVFVNHHASIEGVR